MAELKERLVYNIVAGTQLLQEDFRLKRTMEMFAQLANKNPVFCKIYTGLQQLLQAEKEQQGVLLLNLLGLVDAVLYTQAGFGIEGEFTPLDNKGNLNTVTQAKYSEIQPLLQALHTTGYGNRLETLTNAMLYSPHVLADYRIIHALVDHLDDSYTDMAKEIQRLVKCLGTGEQIYLKDPNDYNMVKPYSLPYVDKKQLVALLKKDFAPQGKKVMATKLSLIGSIAKEEENAWYLSLLKTARRTVREQLMLCLGYSEDNIPLLLELLNKEREANKGAIYSVLGNHTFAGMIDFWQEEFQKNPMSVQYLQYTQSDEISDMLADHLKKQCVHIIQKKDSSQEGYLPNGMYAVVGKTSAKMLKFYRWILDNMDSLTNTRYHERVFGKGGIVYILCHAISETLVYSCPQQMVDFLDDLPQKHADLLAEACFISDLLTKSAAYVYDKWHDKEPPTPKILEAWLEDDILHYQGYHIRILSKMSALTPMGYYYGSITRQFKEPLDSRWFHWMIQRDASDLLYLLMPDGPEELLQTVGAYFHRLAMDTPWTEGMNVSVKTWQCLRMMNRCGWKDFRGTVVAMCRHLPSISHYHVTSTLSVYCEFAGLESTRAEARDILKFYNEFYQDRNKAKELRKYLINEGFLNV